MRRRLEILIPFVLLAVLAQFLAPVGALRAMGVLAPDAMAMASICSGIAAASDDERMPTHPQSGVGCCAFCFSGNAPPGLVTPLAQWTIPSGHFATFHWNARPSFVLASRIGSHAQARAPPHLT